MAKHIICLLNHVATHPDAKISYNVSGVALHIESDDSCISVRQARSRVGGFFLFEHSFIISLKNTTPTPPNGPLHAVYSIPKNVMMPAA